MSNERSRYIDQWRGISALAVVIYHANPARLLSYTHIPTQVIGLMQLCIVRLGQLGLDTFFVISGFLITRLLLREQDETGSVSLKAFYIRRAARILPAMLSYVLIVMLVSAAGLTRLEPVDGVKAVSYLCNTSFVTCAFQFGQFWTLGVEEQFYLLLPLLLIVSGRFRVPVVALTMIVGATSGLIPSLVVHDHFNNGMAVYCLSSGVLFALSPEFRAAFKAVRIPAWALLIPALFSPLYWGGHWEFGHPLALLLIAPLLVSIVLARDGNVLGPKLSEGLRKIGLVSYSLYIWHCFAVWPPEDYLSPTFRALSVLAIPFTWISYRYIELPFIAAGRRWSKAIIEARHSASLKAWT
jgi:peptidoglycan/LPS O-acetylase OafA/YrhL